MAIENLKNIAFALIIECSTDNGWYIVVDCEFINERYLQIASGRYGKGNNIPI